MADAVNDRIGLAPVAFRTPELPERLGTMSGKSRGGTSRPGLGGIAGETLWPSFGCPIEGRSPDLISVLEQISRQLAFLQAKNEPQHG